MSFFIERSNIRELLSDEQNKIALKYESSEFTIDGS